MGPPEATYIHVYTCIYMYIRRACSIYAVFAGPEAQGTKPVAGPAVADSSPCPPVVVKNGELLPLYISADATCTCTCIYTIMCSTRNMYKVYIHVHCTCTCTCVCMTCNTPTPSTADDAWYWQKRVLRIG